MQNNAENKWEEYNLNKEEGVYADLIYNGILPAEPNAMAGKLELTLPFKNGGKHVKITPYKEGYNAVLVGSKYNDIQHSFKIKNNISVIKDDVFII